MKVQLLQRHTHAGVMREPDAVIEVTEPEAHWLAERDPPVIVRGNKKSRWLKAVPNATDEDPQP